MITTENLTTKVLFGINGQANIAVGAKNGTLTLQMLNCQKKIAENIDDSDIKKLPKIEMEFFDVKSIDVMIKALETIKRNYTGVSQLSLAC